MKRKLSDFMHKKVNRMAWTRGKKLLPCNLPVHSWIQTVDRHTTIENYGHRTANHPGSFTGCKANKFAADNEGSPTSKRTNLQFRLGGLRFQLPLVSSLFCQYPFTHISSSLSFISCPHPDLILSICGRSCEYLQISL